MAWPDAHKNFAYSTIATAPSPAASGTSLVVATGEGTLFPAVPFNATIWPTGTQPTAANAEIVRVTNISTDTFTITRTQESTAARTVIVGDQIAAAITNKTLTDIETNFFNSWSPFVLSSAGTGVQTLANASGNSSTGSLFLFPVTIPNILKFNQVLLGNSLGYITSATGAVSNSYYSRYGLYSLSGNTFSLISSSSFSIGETLNSVSLTWNYPTSTATSGWGYGSFPAGNLTATAQIGSFISSTRVIGLHFGGEVSLSAGQYWMGLMSQRSTAGSSTLGFSHGGIMGLVIHTANQVGTVSGLNPIGMAPAEWFNRATNISAWWGRHVVGFLTATSLQNFGGSAIPSSFAMQHLTAVVANSQATILPAVTFVST